MRAVPDPGFPGDDGSVSRALAEALAGYHDDPGRRHHPTLAVLQHSRLLVPVVAVLGEVGYDERGAAHDKASDMATVLMRGRDGRDALLVFTGLEAMQRWDAEARPVPVPAGKVAQAAVQEGAAAIVVDVAGPVRFVVETEDLQQLALGHTLVRLDGGVGGAGGQAGAEVSGRYGWVRPAR